MRGISADISDCLILGGSTGGWWVEVKDAAKRTIVHKAASTAKNYSIQNVSSADLRNPALNK